MGITAKIKKALTLACVIYTVIISVMFAIGWLISDAATLMVPTPSKALCILAFSVVVGFASLILKNKGTGVLRFLLHYAVCLAAYVIAFVIGGGVSLTGSAPIIAVLLFTVVYFVVMILRAVFCRDRGGKTNDVQSEEYTSVFK